MFSLVGKMPVLFADVDGKELENYGWGFGVYQFTLGGTVTFVGLVSLWCSSTTLLSKVAPQRPMNVLVHVGSITTMLSLLVRFWADAHLMVVDLSTKVINTDLVNSMALPLILLCICLIRIVRRNYFYLM